MKRIAITGLGAYTPVGKDINTFFKAIQKGISGGGMITRFDTTKHKSRIACEINEHDPMKYFDRKEVRKMDLFNAHATSTYAGDISEAKAIIRLLNGSDKKPFLCAPKSMTGHLLGAAGAVESLVSILALNKGVVPPTINTNNPDKEIAHHFRLVTKAEKKSDLLYSLSNNFGFGGHNATMIFKLNTNQHQEL